METFLQKVSFPADFSTNNDAQEILVLSDNVFINLTILTTKNIDLNMGYKPRDWS